MKDSARQRVATLRLRLGVGLVVVSWLPLPQIYIWIADLEGNDATDARLVGWTIQIIVGLIGLAFAGVAAKAVVKSVGWRRLPKALWSMLRTGKVPDGPSEPGPG